MSLPAGFSAGRLPPDVAHPPHSASPQDLNTALAQAVVQGLAVQNALLARTSGGDGDEHSSLVASLESQGGLQGGGGVRGALAMERHRQLLIKDPGKAAESFRRNASRHRASNPLVGVSDASSMVAWMSQEVPFDGGKTMSYLGFILAYAADYMAVGKWREAEDVVLKGCLAIDQATCAHGKWQLAWLMTHLPEPPGKSLARRSPKDAIRPTSRLAEPIWVAAAMGYLKETARMAAAVKG